MTHVPNTYPGPCCQRHTSGDNTEQRRKGTCLIKTMAEVEGTMVETPKVYCRECCPVCKETKV